MANLGYKEIRQKLRDNGYDVFYTDKTKTGHTMKVIDRISDDRAELEYSKICEILKSIDNVTVKTLKINNRGSKLNNIRVAVFETDTLLPYDDYAVNVARRTMLKHKREKDQYETHIRSALIELKKATRIKQTDELADAIQHVTRLLG